MKHFFPKTPLSEYKISPLPSSPNKNDRFEGFWDVMYILFFIPPCFDPSFSCSEWDFIHGIGRYPLGKIYQWQNLNRPVACRNTRCPNTRCLASGTNACQCSHKGTWESVSILAGKYGRDKITTLTNSRKLCSGPYAWKWPPCVSYLCRAG